MNQYIHFTDEEIAGLAPDLCARLDMARGLAGVPFVITCGFRTPAQNACLHGAVADSAHLRGLAVDLATGDDHTFNRIIFGLISAGLGGRWGEYKVRDPGNGTALIHHHIHVDCDVTLPQQVTWALIERN